MITSPALRPGPGRLDDQRHRQASRQHRLQWGRYRTRVLRPRWDGQGPGDRQVRLDTL